MIDSATIKGFAGGLLSQRYDCAAATPKCHEEWWEMCCSNNRLVSIAAPRGHAKTTAITHAYTLAMLLFREADFALIVSDTEGQAKEFLGDIIIDLSTNENLIELFELTGFAKDTESAIIVNFKDGKQFKVEAKGAGQKVRGIKWNQKRPNLVIIDDLENEENVATREQRLKLKKWVNGALIPCLSNNGKLRAVGTIIHTDSWLASTMPDESSPLTIHKPLKVYCPRLTRGWHSAKYRGHPAIGDYSQFLWPEYKSEEFFRGEYERLEEDHQTDIYSAEQLNQPIDETYAFFRKTDFRPLPNELPQLNYYASGDMAISTADRADYTAIPVVGMDEAGNLYVVDMRHDRWDINSSIEQIFSVEKEYHPGLFFMEKGTLTRAIGSVLSTEQTRKRIFINLQPMAVSGDKQFKARAIQKLMRSGRVYFDTKAEWYPSLEDEFLRFPRARHDDQVDALALIGLAIDQMIEAPTEEEIEEDRWEEEYGSDEPTGKCKVTGY